MSQLFQLLEDRSENYQQILHTMIEVALRIVEFGYYETAQLLLIRVVRTHKEDHIYCLALWALGCIEWILTKNAHQPQNPNYWAKRNWKDARKTLNTIISETSNQRQKSYYQNRLREMELAIDLARTLNLFPPLADVIRKA